MPLQELKYSEECKDEAPFLFPFESKTIEWPFEGYIQAMLGLRNGNIAIIKERYIYILTPATGKITKSTDCFSRKLFSRDKVYYHLNELPDGKILISCTSQFWEKIPGSFFLYQTTSFSECEFYTYHQDELIRQEQLEAQGITVPSIVILNGKEFACIDQNSQVVGYRCDNLTKPFFVLKEKVSSLIALNFGEYLLAVVRLPHDLNNFRIYQRKGKTYEFVSDSELSVCDRGTFYQVGIDRFIELSHSVRVDDGVDLFIKIWQFDKNSLHIVQEKKDIIIPTRFASKNFFPRYIVDLFPDNETVFIRGSVCAPIFGGGRCVQAQNTAEPLFFNINTLEWQRWYLFPFPPALTFIPNNPAIPDASICYYDHEEFKFLLDRYPLFNKKRVAKEITFFASAKDDPQKRYFPAPIANLIADYSHG